MQSPLAVYSSIESEMACTKFLENRLIIDGKIDEKHALQIYQNNCVLDLVSLGLLSSFIVLLRLLSFTCHILSAILNNGKLSYRTSDKGHCCLVAD